jgi:hypothetical protein
LAAQLSGILDFGLEREHRVDQFGHRRPAGHQFVGLQGGIGLSFEQVAQRQPAAHLGSHGRGRRGTDHEIGRGHIDARVSKPGQHTDLSGNAGHTTRLPTPKRAPSPQ